ncbi:MAG: glycosyltransferase family 4 protein [Nitrospirae bacterium]|nr:glycosyltransferase family 4 protein [Nitrospirota bacterium]
MNNSMNHTLPKGKLRIGIAHPYLGRGGSEARVMWGIEALKKDYDVSLITAGGVDLAALNRFYGTDVKSSEIVVLQAPMPHLLKKLAGGDALRGALYSRFCRKVADKFDVLISAYNLCDFGVPAIHCLADFCWNEEIRMRLHPPPAGARGFFHKRRLVRNLYLKVVRAIAGSSGRKLPGAEDLVLANSRWVSSVWKEKYGADISILYPPVAGGFPYVSHDSREMGFVCIGRISSEKRIERIVEILSAVRARGHDVHLHVVGSFDDNDYGRQVARTCRDKGEWIKMEGMLIGQEKIDLLSQHRFGIHACQGEAFGIAVAEMVKAGCIPFVPREGGSSEIVDNDLVIYDSTEDAIKKIEHVLSHEQIRQGLSEEMRAKGDIYSLENFIQHFRRSVEDFAGEKSRIP